SCGHGNPPSGGPNRHSDFRNREDGPRVGIRRRGRNDGHGNVFRRDARRGGRASPCWRGHSKDPRTGPSHCPAVPVRVRRRGSPGQPGRTDWPEPAPTRRGRQPGRGDPPAIPRLNRAIGRGGARPGIQRRPIQAQQSRLVMLFLLFQLGSDCYALPSSRVVEVLMLPELKSRPGAPQRVAGIFNYRGSPVPAVDLCLLAAGFPARERLGTRLIVVRYPDAQGTERLLGLIAEKVTDTLRKDPREFRDSGLSNRAAPCLGPIYMDGQRPVQWLDERRLVAEPFSNFDRLLPVEYRGEGRPTLERQTKPKNPDRIS